MKRWNNKNEMTKVRWLSLYDKKEWQKWNDENEIIIMK